MKASKFIGVSARLLLLSVIVLPLFALANVIPPVVNAQGTDHPWPMFLQNPQLTSYSDGPAPRQPAILWTYTFGNSLSFSVAASYGKVFVPCHDNQIYALNESSGQKIWNYTLPISASNSPAAADGKVFVTSGDGNIYVLDQSTGSKVWNFTLGGSFFGYMPPPTVADGMVFASSVDAKVYALNQTTGSKIWNFTTDNWIFGGISVSGETVFIADLVNLYALNKDTGTKIWNYTITGTLSFSSSVVASNRVFVVNGTNQLFAIDQSTGNRVWNFTTDGQVLAAPAVAYNKIFINSQVNSNLTKVYALDLNGTQIWQSQTSGSTGLGSPAIADGMAFVTSSNATYASVYTFNQSDGSKVWEYDSVLHTGFTSPIITDGKLIVSFNSTLTAFGIHDLTMTSLAVPSTVNLGDQVRINVTVQNTGDFTESSSVAVYINGTSLGSQTISNLTPDATSTFTFNWNTTSLQAGSYNVTAAIQTVSLERITTDNIQTIWVTASAPVAPAEFPLMLVIGIVVAVVVIAAVIIYLKRRPKKPKPPRLKLTADPVEILADGKSTSTIKVEFVDEKGAAALVKEDTTVSLTSTDGRMAGTVTIPKGQSSATTTITSSTNIGSVGVTAASKGLKETKAAVTFKEKKRYCMHCGEVMAFTARICSKCGRTPPAGVDTKACKNCNSVIPSVAKFCSECGASQPESAS